jgi:hypothetical protein
VIVRSTSSQPFPKWCSMLQPRFPLGNVSVKAEAAHALAAAGQDADFFLNMHVCGVWDEGEVEQNEQCVREGAMVLSKYKTFRSHEILVITFSSRQETCVFCLPGLPVEQVPLTYYPVSAPFQMDEHITEQSNDCFALDQSPLSSYPLSYTSKTEEHLKKPDSLLTQLPLSGSGYSLADTSHMDEHITLQSTDSLSPMTQLPLPSNPLLDTTQMEKSMKEQPSAGSSKFEIVQTDMGGWVRIHHATGPVPNDLALYLSQMLAGWFRQHPHLRLVCVVPISRNGTTVELHGWYECHIFPATASVPQPSK